MSRTQISHSARATASMVACFAITMMAARAQSTHQIDSLAIQGGKVNLNIEGPAGEFKTQSSTTLGTNDWVQLGRAISDGNAQLFEDPLDSSTTRKFYRLESVPAANEFHLTGEFATALIAALAYANLQTTFGLTFAQGEAVISPGNTMSNASLNSRIYSALIATLSKLAQDISNAIPEGSRPTAAEIATALAADISDGDLDGNNSGVPVAIGTSGYNLPAYTSQDFLNALNAIKAEIPGLYNVEFTAAAPAAPPAPSKGGDPEVANAGGGSFSPTAPANWGDFYWDSSAWQ